MSYYDWDGIPISSEEWTKLFGQDRAVDKTKVGERFEVSTVYLGLDHSFGDGPPLIFETMVFSDGPLNEYCERYSTLQAAREGHTRWVVEAHNAAAGLLHPEPSDVTDELKTVLRRHFGYVSDNVLDGAMVDVVERIAEHQRAAVMSS